MARRRRTVWVLKWLGAGLCALIAAGFGARTWWPSTWSIYVMEGAIAVRVDRPFGPIEYIFDDVSQWNWSVGWNRMPFATVLFVPIWLPFLALLLPTLLLWRLDRRRPPPGHCRCGYNLTGLTSGRCPECGTETAAILTRAP